MKFRTSYLVGLMASVLAVSSTTYFIYPAVAADAPQIKPLKIMGPDGQIRQVNHQYGPTTAKDTFWSIAQKVRPDASVSVYQVMAALFDANPHAFYSDSYNSLERGMILLVPSKEVMQAIPNSVAIARAKRVDKQVRTTAKAVAKPSVASPAVKPSTAKPMTPNPPNTQLANNSVNTVATAPVNTPVLSAPIEQPKAQTTSSSQDTAKPNLSQSVAAPSSATAVGTTLTATSSVGAQISAQEAANQSSLDVHQRLEAAQSKTLALTDELARTQDQLTVRNADVKALQAKIDELNQKIAVLDETLMMSKQQNQALTLELAAAQTAQTAPTPLEDATADADDMWRKLMDNPLLLVAAAVAPALVILLLVYWLLRRKRNKERQQLAAQQAAMALGGAAVAGSVLATDDDTLGAMAVQLADEQPDSIDSLLDIHSVDLQLEQDISDSHEQMDMAGEMFIDQGHRTSAAMDELEGQSLDDLWAEAMGEQDQELAAVNEPRVELASKLEDEDFDALLAGATIPVGAAHADEAQAANANAGSESELVSASEVVIAPTPPASFTENAALDANSIDGDLAAEIDAELAEELDSLGVAQPNDDIDALLAAFDQPSAPDTTLADEIAAELDSELDDIGAGDVDDIDALLASFNAPTPAAEPQVNRAAPLSAADEDLDALLAEFNINPDVVHPVNFAEDGATEESATDDRFTDSFAANIADETTRADGLADEVDAERINTLPEELDPRDIDPSDSELDALLAEFEVPEQLDADADDANFDIETAHIDARNVDPVVDLTFADAGEDELLKGIGAGHAIDGTDDTFTLNDNWLEPGTFADAQATRAQGPAGSPEADFSEVDFAADSDVSLAAVATGLVGALNANDNNDSNDKEMAAGLFTDPKANKHADPHVLEWDTELDVVSQPTTAIPVPPAAAPIDAPVVVNKRIDMTATEAQIEPLLATMPEHRQTPSDTEPELQLDLSDDSVLAAFTAQHLADDDDVLTTEDSFLLDGDHTLTVDEALAALDVQESRASHPFSAEHDLSRFQDDYGFIDIDKLLNDAEQDNAPVDLYPEVDVEMSNVEALIGDAAMIDVDDEENSVNAKLDLARAYIEIDDSDSAKALLKEVQIDGNERQQDEAIRLLKEIG